MNPRERRERLFRRSRPYLRAFKVIDGQQYHRDLKVLWAAHRLNPLPGIEGDQKSFANQVTELSKRFDLVMVEDENKTRETAVIRIADDGWRYEPHVIFFPWATRKNILRICVSYFQWARCSRQIGCVEVITGLESKNLFDHVCSYGVLHFVGKMVNGSPDGDTYIYSVKGKKDVSRKEQV